MSKTNATLYICLIALTLSAVIMLTSIASQKIGGEPDALAAVPESTEVTTTAYTAGYVLKEYEGSLALFRENSDVPYRKLDINVSMLTDEDRELMKTGITVKTENELNRLIEDYTG